MSLVVSLWCLLFKFLSPPPQSSCFSDVPIPDQKNEVCGVFVHMVCTNISISWFFPPIVSIPSIKKKGCGFQRSWSSHFGGCAAVSGAAGSSVDGMSFISPMMHIVVVT